MATPLTSTTAPLVHTIMSTSQALPPPIPLMTSITSSTQTNSVTTPTQSPPGMSHTLKDSINLINCSFILIGAIVVIFFLALCLFSRRRRFRRLQSQNNEHNALERDLTNWPGSRRWMRGDRRGLHSWDGLREEGLNERGEAPPPYARDEPSVGATEHGTCTLGMPLMVLSRNGQIRKPPDYNESCQPLPSREFPVLPSPSYSTDGQHDSPQHSQPNVIPPTQEINYR